MSIFFDFTVGVPGRRFRRAVDDDKADIELFLDRKHTDQLFGEVDVGRLIELSTLSICMINENKEVMGFMALSDHPNVTGVAPDDWETWIRNMFQKFYLSRNTLFIHFMCCKDLVIEYFMEEACISVFFNDMYLLNICLIPNPECHPDNVTRYQVLKKKTMYKYNARRSDDSESKPHFMLVATRQDFCPRLKIRRAVEEDNDDIVKILDQKCPRLKELYGSYYISELIGRHPESKRKIIVPEYQEHAVGVMCLNSDINYKKLQSLYELHPYYGLMKATPLEKERLKRNNVLLSTYGEPIMMGKLSPFARPSGLEELDSRDSYRFDHAKTTPRDSLHHKKPSKVIFKRSAKRKNSPLPPRMEHVVQISDDYSAKVFINSPSLSQISYRSFENVMLEEDPFDYEIVNIDKSLLSLAEAFSYELLNVPEMKSSTVSLSAVPSQPQICRRKRNRSVISRAEEKSDSELNIYSGEPNAFMIELFGLRDDVDEKNNSMELLVAAFEIMKNFDYCVICIPTSEHTFPLLQHFTYVPVKEKRCSEYSLYIAHRASVLGRLRVREAEFIDIPLIASFLQNIDGSETIYTIEHSILNRETYQAYVFLSGLSLIGIGILELPEQLNFIRAKYNMDPYHNHKHHLSSSGYNTGFAAVKVVLVYPAFEVHYRFFAREMMRLSGSSSLIWMTAYRNKMVAHKANSMASVMVPLLPRKCEIDYSRIPELKKIAIMAKNMLPFSTWFLDKKLTSVPLVNVTTRILITGASRTCVAFLNALLFSNSSTYLNFTNVTLISSHGLPYMRHTSAAVEMMFPKHHNTSEKYLKSVPYTYYVNTINGTVVEINKQKKYVTLTNGSKYYYDMLFLFFGKQYQHPDYLKPLVERTMQCAEHKPYIRMDIPNKYIEPDYINYNTPSNVFIINHVVQASNALKHIRNLLTEGFDFKVIVYGATIHAYCCLTALLELNVPAENIIFVEPFPSENPNKARVSVFHNANVDETVCEVLNTLDVEVYRSYYFQSWNTIDNIVTHVEFLSQYRMVRLECSAFFYYGKRGVNTQAFLAVNKSGMAYDGGILIDHQYRTKDPSIYAAGPCTAYYRRYFGQTKKQKYYDSYEVGEKLGNQIRNELDPLFTHKSQPRRSSIKFSSDPKHPRPSGSTRSSDDESNYSGASPIKESDKANKQLPHFIKPREMYCRLPGGLQYLEIRAPGKKIPHHYVQSLNYKGVVMETFKSGYFKLHLTNELVVDGITCLTNEGFGLENFKNLYGKSSVILNHVHLRYTTKKLDDFFEYFRSPWAHFLYHDQADELFAMVKELLPKGSTSDTGETLTEALRAVSGVYADATKKIKTRKKFETSPYIEAVTDYVIQWVSQNDILLPMYLHPSDRAAFVHDMGRNPMFRRKRNSITKLMRKVF